MKRSNQSGFSIVEMLIALGIVGGITLGVVKLIELGNESYRQLAASGEILSYTNDLRKRLKDPAFCEANFSGQNIDVEYNPGALLSSDGNNLYAIDQKVGLQGGGFSPLSLESFSFGGTFTQRGDDPDVGVTRLRVGLISENRPNSPVVYKSIQLKVRLDSNEARNVRSCVLYGGGEKATEGESRGYWKESLVGDGIYHDEGPVLINIEQELAGLPLGAESPERLLQSGGSSQDLMASTYAGSSATHNSSFDLFRSFGTQVSRAPVVGSGVNLGGVKFHMWGGSSLFEIFRMQFQTGSGFNASTNSFPTRFSLYENQNATGLEEMARFTSDSSGSHAIFGKNIDSLTCNNAALCLESGLNDISFSSPSDATIKKMIHPLRTGLERLKDLNGYKVDKIGYIPKKNFVETYQDDSDDFSFIAQEVFLWAPEFVKENGGHLYVNYRKMLFPLINGVRSILKTLGEIKTDIAEIRSANDVLETENQKLQKMIEKVERFNAKANGRVYERQ